MSLQHYKEDLDIAKQKIKAREETFNHIEELSNLGSFEIDIPSNIRYYSDNQYKIYGLTKGEDVLDQEFFKSMLLPQYIEPLDIAIQDSIDTKKIIKLQVQIKRKNDGKIIDILYSGKAIFDGDTPVKIVGSAQDITERLAVERHAQELANVINHSSTEVYIIDAKTLDCVYVNQGAINALGYSYEELLSMNILDINSDLTQREAIKIRQEAIEKTFTINRAKHRRKDGTTYHVQAYIHPLVYNNKDALVLFDTDISETIRLEEELLHQANHDILTGLPNRMLLKDRLEQALKSSARYKEKFSLLFIDLDKFKQINDSLGHDAGDKVLIEASMRIRSCIREEDTLARVGGDEFVIILRHLKKNDCSSIVSKNIVQKVRQEMQIDGHTLFIAASVGISECPDDASNESSLMKFADLAMYKAKEEGDRYVYYHDV